MKGFKRALILLIATACGLLASTGVYQYLKGKEEFFQNKLNIEPPTQQVVIAARDIPWGTTLSEEDIATRDWLMHNAPKGSFSSKEKLIGRIAKREMLDGEPILPALLIPDDGILGTIPEGKRAMSVEVDKVISVHGFIQPGSYVDVIAITQLDEEEYISKIILQNIEILAIGKMVDMEEASRKSRESKITAVTLALSPESAEKLALAMHKGRIHLVLRNYTDREIVATDGTTQDTLLGRINKQKDDATYNVIEVIKDGERHEEKFSQGAFGGKTDVSVVHEDSVKSARVNPTNISEERGDPQ